MKFIGKSIIGLAILIATNMSAMAPQPGKRKAEVLENAQRISLRIINKSDKNLNILQQKASAPYRVGSVRGGNNSVQISNIELVLSKNMPNEQQAYFEIVDPQANKTEYRFHILRQQKFDSEKRQIVVSFVPQFMNQPFPEEEYFKYDASKGAVTVLVTITITNPHNPPVIDITSVQGPVF